MNCCLSNLQPDKLNRTQTELEFLQKNSNFDTFNMDLQNIVFSLRILKQINPTFGEMLHQQTLEIIKTLNIPEELIQVKK